MAGERVLDVYYAEPRLGAWGDAGHQPTGRRAATMRAASRP